MRSMESGAPLAASAQKADRPEFTLVNLSTEGSYFSKPVNKR